MNKGGISAVVATVLIILITVAGVTIVWTAIIPMIQQGLLFSDLDGRVSIVSSGGYTAYDRIKGVAMVQVKRELSDVVMNQIRVVFSINGSSFGSLVPAPDSGLTKVYIFNLSEYGEPDSVKVVPIFIVGDSEKEGSVTSDIMIPKGTIFDVPDVIYELEDDYIFAITECNDGIDNDGNSLIDYPNDPGCTDSSDNDEYTPAINTLTWGDDTLQTGSGTFVNWMRCMSGTSQSTVGMIVSNISVSSGGSGRVRLAVYQGGTLSDPNGAVLICDGGTITASAGFTTADCSGESLAANKVTWICVKGNDNTFEVHYDTNWDSSSNFQSNVGRYLVGSDMSTDERVAYESIIDNVPAGGFSAYWYSEYLTYEF
ncbi:MAG: hypothetical protein ABIH79_00500 [archaeon]